MYCFLFLSLLVVISCQEHVVPPTIGELKKRLSENPRDTVAHLDIARLLIAEGALQNAATHYQQVLAIDESTIPALLGLGEIAQKQGRFTAAESWFHKALQIDSNHTATHCKIGNLALRQGEHAIAEGHYRNALDLEPEHTGAQYHMALAKIKLTSYSEAADLLQKVITLDNSHTLAYYTLGQIYNDRLGRATDAVNAYRQAVVLKPSWPLAHIGLGQALLSERRFGEALSAFEQAVALDSTQAQALIGVAEVREWEGDPISAEKSYLAAIAHKPLTSQAYIRLGNLYSRMDRPSEAARYLKHFEQIRPYANRIAKLQSQLRGDPNDALALYSLGVLYTKVGATTHSVSAFRHSIALRSDNAQAHNNLGNALLRSGQIRQAIPHYREAVRLDSSYFLAYYNLAQAYLYIKQPEESLATFRTAARIKPDNPEVYQGIVQAYRAQGLAEQASKAMQRYQALKQKLKLENP